MKAEISNLSPTGVRSWSGVYLQQGRMLVDRDWNELCAILSRLTTDAADEAIGTGTPRHDGLMRRNDDGLFVRADGGLVAASGLIGRAEPREPEAEKPLYTNQLHLPPDIRRPQPGASPDDTHPLLQDLPGGGYLYVDIWERVVTAFEASDLIDAALNGADTTFRTQRMVQLKRGTADDLEPKGDPCLPRFDPARIPEIGTVRVTVEPAAEIETSDDCDPCADQVTLQSAQQNHLFRLEIHDVVYDKRVPVRIVLKWSNDNGATELFFDETDRQRSDRSYEYFSDASEMLLGMPSDDWPGPSSEWRGQIDPKNPDKLADVLPRVREWDGWATFERSGGGNWELMEGRSFGVELSQTPAPPPGPATVSANASTIFIRTSDKLIALDVEDAVMLAGDTWYALSRARAAEGEQIRVLSETPAGVRHHYCLIGDIKSFGDEETEIGPQTPHDLRRLNHPALTCLDADDVGYETSCPSGLFTSAHDTVKKALDRICSIDAEHVGYATTCPSGLFTSAHDTVEKALDRICSIDAEHVGYATTCPSGLFTSAHDTVEKALDRICSLDAGHVGYQASCPSGLFTSAHNTVEKALDRVCSINAAHIAYDPGCDLLSEANANTVAQAIDVLCDNLGQGPAQDLPKILKVNWRNDLSMSFDKFFTSGLLVTFDRNMLDQCATSDNFIVELEVPSQELLSDTILLMHRILVPGTIVASGAEWRFLPDGSRLSQGQLQEIFGIMTSIDSALPGYRCRVTLTGDSILDEDGKLQLDGEVLKVPKTTSKGTFFLDLEGVEDNKLVSGNGQPGGDFESWFYLANETTVAGLTTKTDITTDITTGTRTLSNSLHMLLVTQGGIAQGFNKTQLKAFPDLVSFSTGNPEIKSLVAGVKPDIALDPDRRASKAKALAAFKRMDADGRFTLICTEPLSKAAETVSARVSDITAGKLRLDPVAVAEGKLLKEVVNNKAGLILLDQATATRLGSALQQLAAPLLQF